MIDEFTSAIRLSDELFIAIMQYAFVVFVISSVIILFGVAIKFILYVGDKYYLWWNTFVDIQQKRANRNRRVDVLWGDYQYQLKQRDKARKESGIFAKPKGEK